MRVNTDIDKKLMPPNKRITWTTIKSALERDILDGTLKPGDQLPTEPDLVARFGAGRHSVRRAVAALAKDGKVSVEQGRGTFVENTPLLTYAISRRTRLRQNLSPQGFEVSGDLLSASVIEATEKVLAALNLEPGAQVIESRRITYADTVPIATGVSYHSAARFPDFLERREKTGSVTQTYKSYGIDDYLRGETTMHARQARPHEAKLLKQHPDLPVIVVRAVDTILDGTPIAFKEVVWSAERVQFTMSDRAQPDQMTKPSDLR